ncbi:hypothetical protein ACFX13_022452 [Malus domestica]
MRQTTAGEGAERKSTRVDLGVTTWMVLLGMIKMPLTTTTLIRRSVTTDTPLSKSKNSPRNLATASSSA